MAELSLHGETSGCKVADKRDGKAKSGTSRSQSACCTVLHSKTINRSNYMVIISRFFFFFSSLLEASCLQPTFRIARHCVTPCAFRRGPRREWKERKK